MVSPIRSPFLYQIAGEEMGKYVFSVSACVGVITDSINWETFGRALETIGTRQA